MEFYVLRSEKRQLETNIISAADAFSLAASPSKNKMRALPAIPSLGQANQGKGPDQSSLRDGPLFPISQALRTWLLIGVPSSFVSPFHEKTRQRVDYGAQAGTNLHEGTPTVASR
jgi:hypothetical protein